MNKRPCLFFLGALLLFTGCIKFDHVLTLRPDGSGAMEFKYTIPENSLSQFKTMMKLKDNLTIDKDETFVPFEETDLHRIFLNSSEEQAKKELRTYEEYGITAETVKIQSVHGQRQAHFVIMFDNLAKIARTEIFGEYGFNVTRDKNGDFVLSRPPERILAGRAQSSSSVLSEKDLKGLSPFLSGFHAGIRIVTPSRIITSSAQRKASDNVAVWNFDFDTNPNALTALENQKFEVVFDGTDRGIKIPQVRMRTGLPAESK